MYLRAESFSDNLNLYIEMPTIQSPMNKKGIYSYSLLSFCSDTNGTNLNILGSLIVEQCLSFSDAESSIFIYISSHISTHLEMISETKMIRD